MFNWRKYLAEQSARLQEALFSVPYSCSIRPELYWSMAGNQDLLIQRKRQYAEEMDKIIQQIAPLIAMEPITMVVDADKIVGEIQNED